VTDLEQAGGIRAEVVGKPAAPFFAAVLAHLGADLKLTGLTRAQRNKLIP